MLIYDVLKQYENEKIKIFVDMDGCIADYEVGFPKDYDLKRPLVTNISKLEKISQMPNIQLYILSVTRMNKGIEEKNKWLDQFAPFFKKGNRNILSREKYSFKKDSPTLKYEFIKSIKRDDSKIIIIDDDPEVLKKIRKGFDDVILLKDTTLVD